MENTVSSFYNNSSERLSLFLESGENDGVHI